jgi:hypothetical protein
MTRGEEFDPKMIASDAGLTAAFEAITRTPAAILFRQPRAMREITEGAGKRIGMALKDLAEKGKVDPNFRQASSKINAVIDSALSNVKDRSGAAGALINRWRKIINSGPTTDANTLIQFERALGDAADFGKAQKLEKGVTIANTALNNAVMDLRNRISGIVDNLAVRAGYKSFRKDSLAVANSFKKLSQKQQTPFHQMMKNAAVGVVAGAASGNPAVGAAASMAANELESRGTRQLLHALIEKTGAGRAATVGATEAGRRVAEPITQQV